MARIYDNIELKFEKGLKDLITTQGVVRTDFCVGYFNLRGWNRIIKEIDKVLAKHYGFTDEELDFIINYDIKYRMGEELNEE